MATRIELFHTEDPLTREPRRLTDGSVADCSGYNWDDAAMTALRLLAFRPDWSQMLTLTRDSNLPAGADLSDSDLHRADLRNADLSCANLSRSNLAEARLDRANLEQADLRGADLRSAHLAAARLDGARLYGAIFNQWTDLPFSKEEAVRKGMIYLEIST